jgi:Peptidase propeptide and YPEB domain
MHKKMIYLCLPSVLLALMLAASSTVLTTETTWGQMMGGPNMMNKAKIAMGSGLNFTKGENITASIDFMSAITKAIASQIKTSLSDASSAAEKSIGNNSHAVAAHISDENGYLVYVVVIADSNGKVHKLIIDPANGKILLSRELSGFEALMMLHQGMGTGGHNYPMMRPGSSFGR